MTVQVGRVSDRKGAKLHAINGRCPSLHRGLIGNTVHPLTAEDAQAGKVCGHCRPHLLAAADKAARLANAEIGVNHLAGGRTARVAVTAERLVEALYTAAERDAVKKEREAFRTSYEITHGLAVAA